MKIEDIKNISVIGAGAMGHGIAQLCAMAGYNVYVMDVKEEFLKSALEKIKWSLGKLAEKKVLKESVENVLKRVKTTVNLTEAIRDADFMIEAVPEILELKKKIFKDADLNSPKHTILATNTSSLPITEIAEATSRPEKVVGMHFFNPPQLMRLVEVIYGDKTSNETVNLTVELARRLGKEPVICRRDVIGFIANRVMIPPTFVTGWLVNEGVFKPEEIDSAAYYRGGQRMGVFGLMDFVGIDVHYNVSKFFEEREAERFKVPPIIEDKAKRGELGVKTGRGFYEYPDKTWRTPTSWSESLADKFNPLINVFISINIAAELVDQGIASIEDVDKAVKLGYNLPFGVLEIADKVGVKEVVKQLEELASKYGHIDKLGKLLTPHPLLKRMAETGEKFYK